METIPPSEIGFLAMHFGAALERKRNQLRRIAAVIVCPTGIGTSRLLAAGLQREYPNLDVRGVMSAFQLDPDKLRAEGVELVVSTVELDIKFRYLRVNPMLTMQDKMLLGTAIDALLLQKKDTPPPPVAPLQALTRQDVDFIGALGQEIYALLDHVRIRHAPIVRTPPRTDRASSHALRRKPRGAGWPCRPVPKPRPACRYLYQTLPCPAAAWTHRVDRTSMLWLCAP